MAALPLAVAQTHCTGPVQGQGTGTRIGTIGNNGCIGVFLLLENYTDAVQVVW